MRLSSLVFTDPDCTTHIFHAAACNKRGDHRQHHWQAANTIFNILSHISSVSLCWVTGEGSAGFRLPRYSLTYAMSVAQPLAGQPAPLPRRDAQHNAGTGADQRAPRGLHAAAVSQAGLAPCPAQLPTTQGPCQPICTCRSNPGYRSLPINSSCCAPLVSCSLHLHVALSNLKLKHPCFGCLPKDEFIGEGEVGQTQLCSYGCAALLRGHTRSPGAGGQTVTPRAPKQTTGPLGPAREHSQRAGSVPRAVPPTHPSAGPGVPDGAQPAAPWGWASPGCRPGPAAPSHPRYQARPPPGAVRQARGPAGDPGPSCGLPRSPGPTAASPRPGRGPPRAPGPSPASPGSRAYSRAYPGPTPGPPRSRPYLHGVGADDLPAEAQPELQRQRRFAGAGSAEDHHQRPRRRRRRGPAQAKRGRRHGPARPGGCHGDGRAGRGRDGAGTSRGEDGAGPYAPCPSARRGSCPRHGSLPLAPAPARVPIPVPCPSPRPRPLLGSPGHPPPSGPPAPGPCPRVGFGPVVPFWRGGM